MKPRKRVGKRKHEEEPVQVLPDPPAPAAVPPALQPPLKLKLSLTKSPVKGGVTEFSVVTKQHKDKLAKLPRDQRPVFPPPSSSSPPPKRKVKRPPPEEALEPPRPSSPSPLPTLKKKMKKQPIAVPERHPVVSEEAQIQPLVKKKVKRPVAVEELPPPPPRDPSPPPRVISPLPVVKRKPKKEVTQEPPTEPYRAPSPPSRALSPPPIIKKKVRMVKKTEEPFLPQRVHSPAAQPSEPLQKVKKLKKEVIPEPLPEPPRQPSPPPVALSPLPCLTRRKVKKDAVIEPAPDPPRAMSPQPRALSPTPATKKKVKLVKKAVEPFLPQRVPSPAPPPAEPLPKIKKTKKEAIMEPPEPLRSPTPPPRLPSPPPMVHSAPPRVLSPPPIIKKTKLVKKIEESYLPPRMPSPAPQPSEPSEPLPKLKKVKKPPAPPLEPPAPLPEVGPLPKKRGRPVAEPSRQPLSPVQRPRSPELELNFPARITARETVPRPQPSNKKSIFKSRSKTEAVAPAAHPVEPRRPPSPPTAPFLEEPRVPLISSAADLFKAWDAEIPALASEGSPTHSNSSFPDELPEDLEPPHFPEPPSPEPLVQKPTKTFFKSRGLQKEVVERPPPRPVPEDPPAPLPQKKAFVPAPRPAVPVSKPTPPLVGHGPQLGGAASPDFKVNFPTRITAPEGSASLPSGRVVGQKRSIFKSKSKENTAPPKKALSLYKHKLGWGGEDRDKEKVVESSSQPSTLELLSTYDDSEFDDGPGEGVEESNLSFAPGKLTRVATYPSAQTGIDEEGDMVTQVKCPKSYKEYYTVIKKVKKAHEMNDLGEYQEFADDVEYIADGMKSRNSVAARCLAAVSLAQKCMKPSFRMHLRAHGEVRSSFVI